MKVKHAVPEEAPKRHRDGLGLGALESGLYLYSTG